MLCPASYPGLTWCTKKPDFTTRTINCTNPKLDKKKKKKRFQSLQKELNKRVNHIQAWEEHCASSSKQSKQKGGWRTPGSQNSKPHVPVRMRYTREFKSKSPLKTRIQKVHCFIPNRGQRVVSDPKLELKQAFILWISLKNVQSLWKCRRRVHNIGI